MNIGVCNILTFQGEKNGVIRKSLVNVSHISLGNPFNGDVVGGPAVRQEKGEVVMASILVKAF